MLSCKIPVVLGIVRETLNQIVCSFYWEEGGTGRKIELIFCGEREWLAPVQMMNDQSLELLKR
jgi:hypothetical protein